MKKRKLHLENKLNNYRKQSKGVKSQIGTTAQHIAKTAAIALPGIAFLTAPLHTRAATGTRMLNITIQGNYNGEATALIDLDGGGANDFRFVMSDDGGAGQHAYEGVALLMNGLSGSRMDQNGTGGGVQNLRRLTSGQTINANAAINIQNMSYQTLHVFDWDMSALLIETGFVGVRFQLGAVTHYGWIEVSFEAYNDNPGSHMNRVNLMEMKIIKAGWSTNASMKAGEGAVPIDLARFWARTGQDLINLNWETASEVDNAGFELQRSTDGKEFKTIAFIDGAGTTYDKQEYFYDDREIRENQMYFYRLRQIDYDGNFEFSDMVTAIIRKDEIFSDFVPNPAPAGKTSIDYNSDGETEVELTVYDVSGKAHIQQQHQLLSGNNTLDLHFTDLTAGTYFVKFKDGSQNVYKKLIVK